HGSGRARGHAGSRRRRRRHRTQPRRLAPAGRAQRSRALSPRRRPRSVHRCRGRQLARPYRAQVPGPVLRRRGGQGRPGSGRRCHLAARDRRRGPRAAADPAALARRPAGRQGRAAPGAGSPGPFPAQQVAADRARVPAPLPHRHADDARPRHRGRNRRGQRGARGRRGRFRECQPGHGIRRTRGRGARRGRRSPARAWRAAGPPAQPLNATPRAGGPQHAPRYAAASYNARMIDSSRHPRLARIDSPARLREFDEAELPAIADELRAYLIESVGRSGGHFGAGLGVVELTTALHYLYDTPHDRIVWDVGHQAYPHKILTGRRDTIHTVKQKNGEAPSPKREESEGDTFGVGHSSTSIPAALGMADASARAGEERKVVAVIGDGAMTAGMAYEALNHAGGMEPEPNLLVILNDNRMSISENVGGLTRMLGRATGSHTLNALREGGKKLLGDRNKPPARFVRRWEEHWKGMLLPSTLFEEMGFHYTGPIDGHDMKALVSALKLLRGMKGPQLLH